MRGGEEVVMLVVIFVKWFHIDCKEVVVIIKYII